MIKILAIGDSHHHENNSKETLALRENILSILEKHQPDVIIMLGDDLHTHERMHIVPVNNLYRLVLDMRRWAPVYMVVGNHCYQNNQCFLSDSHSLNLFKPWSGVTVVDRVTQISVKGCKFTLVPYVPVGRFFEALEDKSSYVVTDTEFDWKESNCIFAHQEFRGCKMGAIVSVEGDIWSEDFPFVISGHIHSTQRPQKNIYYPGSSTQVAFGENDSPLVTILSWESPSQLEPTLDDIVLSLPLKKIMYTDSESISDFSFEKVLKEGQDPSLLKISVSGNSEEFKTFKKSKKYEEMIKKGVKVIFKPKRLDIKRDKEELEDLKSKIHSGSSDVVISFKEVLYRIASEGKDSDMIELYEMLVNGNLVKSEDILLL